MSNTKFKKAIVVFPGQGSQRIGMGRDFCDQFSEARTVFEEAGRILDIDMFTLCHTENDRLNLTEFTQPAILCTEIAMLAALRRHFALTDTLWAGHSLGEYAALAAAGAIPFDCAIRLVRTRGHLMQSAVAPGEGSMTAVVQNGLDVEKVRSIAEKFGVDIANHNSPSQVVLSGPADQMQQAMPELEQCVESGNGRVVPLQVSGPFHSRWMRRVEPEYRAVLEDESARFDSERARNVTSNATGKFHDGTREELVDTLTRQISSPVQWIANMRELLAAAGKPILEVGPAGILQKFFKEMGANVPAIISVRHAYKALQQNQGEPI